MPDTTTLLIGGHRKSGTTLLHSLFDSHPEIYTPPHDLNILYGFYPWCTDEKLSRGELEDRFKKVTLDNWKAYYAGTDTDLERFESINTHFATHSRDVDLRKIDKVVDLVISAFWASAPKTARVLAVKETSSEIYVPWLMEDRPDWMFLHLVRDPRDNYAALFAGQKSYYGKLGDDELKTLSSTLIRYKLGVHAIAGNSEKFGANRYKVVRFEDIVRDTENQMADISKWLGATWSNTLKNPTRNGKKFHGNNHDGKEFDGISTYNLGRWKSRIGREHAAVIEHVLKDEMAFFGYEPEIENTISEKCAADWYSQFNYANFFSDPF